MDRGRSLIPSFLIMGGLVAGFWAPASQRTGPPGAVGTAGAAEGPSPVIVELFTSEGCSSCPPADRLLIHLQQTQPVPGARVISLSQHVDYWNRLGWADPFSSPQFSARQQGYSRFFATSGPYTPQMVVDGQVEFVGSDSGRAVEAVSRAARNAKASVRISRRESTREASSAAVPLQINVEGLDRVGSREPAEVWLAVTEDGLESAVARGENAGRRLQHVAVVRELKVIGMVHPGRESAFGAEASLKLRPEWKQDSLHAVVFLQERRSRRIIGAGTMEL